MLDQKTNVRFVFSGLGNTYEVFFRKNFFLTFWRAVLGLGGSNRKIFAPNERSDFDVLARKIFDPKNEKRVVQATCAEDWINI